MELIEIKDLEVGDEVIIACQANFKYLRVLQKPKFGAKKHWRTGAPLFGSVKCSTRRVEKQVSWTSGGGTTYTRTEHEWEFGPEDHNYNHYVNLNYRQIILVKKADS